MSIDIQHDNLMSQCLFKLKKQRVNILLSKTFYMQVQNQCATHFISFLPLGCNQGMCRFFRCSPVVRKWLEILRV